MEDLYNQMMNKGKVLTQCQDFKSAINAYESALEYALEAEHKIDALNNLGSTYMSMDNAAEAIKQFENSIDLYNELPGNEDIDSLTNKGSVFNNLGALYGSIDTRKAIGNHKEALKIFEVLFNNNQTAYVNHLANTYYSIGNHFQQSNDSYQAIKSYSKIAELYKDQGDYEMEKARPLLASTYFQLGSLKADEDKIQDARTYYHKSLHHYEILEKLYPYQFLPQMSSAMNNLAVVNRMNGYLSESIKYYKKTIEIYEQLIRSDQESFLPYFAASLNALANVYADTWTPEDDMFSGDRGFLPGFGIFSNSSEKSLLDSNKNGESDLEIAESYYKKSLDIYRKLAVETPEQYTHYVAMILHNLGVMYDENKDFKKAEVFYHKALVIRKELAGREPESFDADVCTTQMNLVTMYQTLMEREVDISLKERCLDLLKDTRLRLSKFDRSDLPNTFMNLMGDLEYFTNYFDEVTEAQLSANVSANRASHLYDEALSTLDLVKRQEIFKQILLLITNELGKFPENQKLLNEMEYYLPRVVSNAILTNDCEDMKTMLDKIKTVVPDNFVILTQEALLWIARGKNSEAETIFSLIRNNKNPEDQRIIEMVKNQAEELGIEIEL